ncbi:MAG: malto-oligosyltrehalose synthase [Geobacter sp.]|nr:malto-oligosyltrehalose synthase [Geobacter sp.]
MDNKARIPLATYRLQLNRGFNFAAARDILPYLDDLGITDIYASPIFAAREGSPHGYDIVDHNALNREIGTEEEFGELCGGLGSLGMGLVMDFVPNHMCIESSANARWMDVLENGPASQNAYFFDIDWEPVKKELRNKVLLPLLAGQYGNALENGELALGFHQGAFYIHYGEFRLPVEPASYLHILHHRLEELKEPVPADAPLLLELLSIITSLEHLPSTTEQDPDKREERYREKEIVKNRLARLCEKSPEIAGFIGENVRIFNGIKGEPASFDLLDGLMREQAYRLSFWRVATEEINYRRFFDINGLGAIRMEDPLVFKETHLLLFRLIREGKITGVRVDHIDGLYDPYAYLHRLQKGCFTQLRLAENSGMPADDETAAEGALGREYDEAVAANPAIKAFYIIGEKILLKGERLPEDWPVFSTTGYDFLNTLNGIFVDTDSARKFDRTYDRFGGGSINFQEVIYEKKKLVMQVAMSGEINTLGHQLNAISERDRLTRDFTLNSLTRAISEVIACFPVYRTYTNSMQVREKDSQYVEEAVARAKRKNPAISAYIFDFLRDVLLLRLPEHATEGNRMEWLHFVMRFQQITGPIMAKGVEDTAFYVYNRLASLNEVGGTPDRFGTPLDTFHGQNLERLKSFPHSLTATSTHDSKRGEDVRARLSALSEVPDEWRKALLTFRAARRKRELVEGEPVPSRNEEYLLYQTLLGAWPTGPMDEAAIAAFGERITDYMTKGVREAKVNSSWINPNIPYEEALAAFIAAILADKRFMREFRPFQERIARLGMFTSLSQTLLKITSPGVPDFYQGTELWDLTLVDPDNRRPVDFGLRREALSGLARREKEIGPLELIRELLAGWEDGRIKLYITLRTLNFRRENRELFENGDYLPLEVSGEKERHVCAFARRQGGKSAIAVAPRFFAALVPEPGMLPCGEGIWGETFVTIPEETPGTLYRNIFTNETVTAIERDGKTTLPLAAVFTGAPVALLERSATTSVFR